MAYFNAIKLGTFAPHSPRFNQKTNALGGVDYASSLPTPESALESEHGRQARYAQAASQGLQNLYGATNDPTGSILSAAADRRDAATAASVWARLEAGDPTVGMTNEGNVMGLPGQRELKEALAGKRVAGGESAPGSNQLTGVSAQPNYLTTGMTFMGRPNANYQTTNWDPSQSSAVTPSSADMQALQGLFHFRPRGYQTHDDWMAAQQAKGLV